MLIAAVTLLSGLRPRAGQSAVRPQWVDVSIAILITTALVGGVMVVIAGVLG
jgi:hypothetical protein